MVAANFCTTTENEDIKCQNEEDETCFSGARLSFHCHPSLSLITLCRCCHCRREAQVPLNNHN